ncbi:MAG: glycosyltransferase family 4 protein [Bacteroidota bacterium]
MLSAHWQTAGAHVEVVTSTAYFPEDHPAVLSNKPAFVYDTDTGVRVHVLPVAYTQKMGFRQRIQAFTNFYYSAKRYAKQLARPDIIYASSTPLTVAQLGHDLGKRWQVPWVFEAVDVWPDVPIGMGILTNPVLKSTLNHRTNKLYRSAHTIFALSPGMREQILSHGVPPAKVHVSYNGTEPERFHPQTAIDEQVQLVYAGALGRANAVGELVGCWAALCDKDETVRNAAALTIYGFGAQAEAIKRQVAEQRERGVPISFEGKLPKAELAEALGQFDVGICWFADYPVLEANSANKFYDYLAAGLPVLTNYAGWQGKVLGDHKCGLSSPQGQREAFQDNLRRLIMDAALRQSYSTNARKLAVQQFDRRQIAADLLRRFKRVISPATD